MINLGEAAWLSGDGDSAERWLGEAMALAKQLDASWLMPSIAHGLGLSAACGGDYPRAASFLHESLDLACDLGNLGHKIAAIEGLARVAAAVGQEQRAVRLFAAAMAVRNEIEMPQSPTRVTYFAPVLDFLRAALGAAQFETEWAAGQALSHEEALVEALGDRVAQTELPAAAAGHRAATENLTTREREILRLLAAGEDDRAIGARLFISPTTVARHVANVRGKLGVHSRAKLAAYAQRHGLA